MRLFLAIDPPHATRERLGRLIARLAAGTTGWRWIRAEGVHLTVRFLGEVSAECDAAARPGWREAVQAVPPFVLRAAGLAAFPNPRRPRVLVVPLRGEPSGPLEELAQRLEHTARQAGFSAQTRAFRPHWTLARAAHGARPPVPQDPGMTDETAPVTQVNLVESTLVPSGARYTVRDVYSLGERVTEGA